MSIENGDIQKCPPLAAWWRSKETSGVRDCGGIEESFMNEKGRGVLETDFSSHPQLLAALCSWSHGIKKMVENRQLLWLCISMQYFLLATRCRECINPAHFLVPGVCKISLVEMTKGLDDISKKGFSRSFRTTANEQKLGEMRKTVLSTKTYKEKLIAFFIHLLFCNFRRFSV